MQKDIINGVTPLERLLANSHPRIFFNEGRIAEVRAHMTEEPWARMLKTVAGQAAQGSVPCNAVLFLLTDGQEHCDAAREGMLRIINKTDWPENVTAEGTVGYDELQDLALGYDWLHEHLDPDVMVPARKCMHAYGDTYYSALGRHEIYEADTYEWNVFMHSFANFATAVFAIYGDVDKVGPWIRGIIEKCRVVAQAMGPDGVSPEGICYGGFFSDYCVRTFDMVAKLVGWNIFEKSEHLRNIPYFHLYSMIGSDHVAQRSVHHCFGDGCRWNWHGPVPFLRRLASEYRDRHAQWLARFLDERDATGKGGAFLNLAWYDPSVEEAPPDGLPTFRHFDDKRLVVMRSGWDGDESVFALRCGPHAGHHALENYQQCIGGGHMAPDAGSFQLHGCGDWLIVNAGYAIKHTEYHNTVTVNGIGQTGASDGELAGASDWFECLQLRRERRGPSILQAFSSAAIDYAIADPSAAYEPQAGLTKFLRHILYLKPSVWVLVDELQADKPATFDLYFHAFGEQFQADRPFRPDHHNSWITGGEHGSARITAVAPCDVEGFDELQAVRGTGDGSGPHRNRDLCTLRLRNAEPTDKAVFITVIEAFPTAQGPSFAASCGLDGAKINLSVGDRTFSLTPGQEDPARPIWDE